MRNTWGAEVAADADTPSIRENDMPTEGDYQANKLKARRKTLRMYLLVAIIAILPRILVFYEWAHSPFPYYYCIHGLDMRKFIIMSDHFVRGSLGFTAYRFFLAAVMALSGRDLFIPAITVAQMAIGVATALMTTHIYRRIFGGRLGAGVAGALCAIYLPCVVYETHILKSTLYLFLATLPLSLILEAHRRGFRVPATFAAGIAIPGAFLVRVAGLPWLVLAYAWLVLKARAKGKRGIAMYAAAGTAAVLIAVVALNAARGLDSWYLVKHNYVYLFSTGAVSKMKTLSPPEQTSTKNHAGPGLVALAAGYGFKAISIFLGRSIPNNVNVAFERSKLASLRHLLPQLLLIPLAAAGLAALVLSGLARGKASLLFFHLAAFSATMIVFFPLERYRLVLTPVFCVAATWWLSSLVRLFKNQAKPSENHGLADTAKLAIPFIVFVVSLVPPMIMGPIERSSDKQAYGIAASIVPDALMARGHFAEAAAILEHHRTSAPDNNLIRLNLASALLGQGKIEEAENLLRSMENIRTPAMRGRRYYEMGEAAFIKGAYKQAANYYQECLKYPISKTRQRLAGQRLNMCREKSLYEERH